MPFKDKMSYVSHITCISLTYKKTWNCWITLPQNPHLGRTETFPGQTTPQVETLRGPQVTPTGFFISIWATFTVSNLISYLLIIISPPLRFIFSSMRLKCWGYWWKSLFPSFLLSLFSIYIQSWLLHLCMHWYHLFSCPSSVVHHLVKTSLSLYN